jgi:hypothetical protein
MPDIKHEVTQEDIERWCKTLYRRAGIQVVTFKEGVNGLVNVPDKYVRVIDAMHMAMVNLAAGDSLPEFAPIEATKPKKRTKKR